MQVFQTGGWMYSLAVPIQVISSIHVPQLLLINRAFCDQRTKEIQNRSKRDKILFFFMNKDQTDPLSSQKKPHLNQN